MRKWLGNIIGNLAQKREDRITAKLHLALKDIDPETQHDLYTEMYRQYWLDLNYGLSEDDACWVAERMEILVTALSDGNENHQLINWWRQSRYYTSLIIKKLDLFFNQKTV